MFQLSTHLRPLQPAVQHTSRGWKTQMLSFFSALVFVPGPSTVPGPPKLATKCPKPSNTLRTGGEVTSKALQSPGAGPQKLQRQGPHVLMQDMAASIHWGVLLVGVLVIRALLFWVYVPGHLIFGTYRTPKSFRPKAGEDSQ